MQKKVERWEIRKYEGGIWGCIVKTDIQLGDWKMKVGKRPKLGDQGTRVILAPPPLQNTFE